MGPNNYKKRGNVFAFCSTVGGKRLRLSMGVRDPKSAQRLAGRISYAISSGPNSTEWADLKPALPESTFKTLADVIKVPVSPSLSEFETSFYAKLIRRETLGELAPSSHDLYRKTADTFFAWLRGRVGSIADVTPTLVEEFLCERKDSLTAKGGTAKGMVTVYTVLSTIFNHAFEEGLIRVSPLKNKYKPEQKSEPPNPFTKEELDKLSATTDSDRLLYLILRHTGLRGSDVAALDWSSIIWTDRVLTCLTKKRKTWVTVPLIPELYAALERESDSAGQIFKGLTRAKLYRIIGALGERAEVENTHPHRFRTTLACELLAKGASIFDVAKLLGDAAATVDKYYGAITSGQQQRVRGIMEKSS